MDRSWVKDIQMGQRAAGVYAVARKQQAMGKNGKPFLKVLLQDKTGQLDARVWNQAEELAGLFEAGDRVRVEGQVASFQGRPQLTIEAIEKSPDVSNPEDFAYEAPAPAQTTSRSRRRTVEIPRVLRASRRGNTCANRPPRSRKHSTVSRKP